MLQARPGWRIFPCMSAFPQRVWSARARLCLCALSVSAALGGSLLSGADQPKPWAEKDSRLATEYLNLLVEKPEYGRVLDLLWSLYEKHEATSFLLENIATQAAAQPHPSVLLVHAHLQRKAGDTVGARVRYEEVLKLEADNVVALRALADLAVESGDPETGLKHLDTLLATYPAADAGRVPLLVEQGRLWLDLNKAKEAAIRWNQAVALKPDEETLKREVAQLMLGAGLMDEALALYQNLAKQSDPAKRLDALYDLSRLEEQADHFAQAADALREGLSLLHFRDWRYAQFFQKLVKLHERFGQLDALKADLLKAVESGHEEKALSDLVRFLKLTVDTEARVHWLQVLVREFPQQQEYRWELVSELLDHDGAQEAANLLDSVLKGDGSDTSSLILMRALAHLRLGEADKASHLLAKLLEAQGGNADIEKQVLAFAREKSLDQIAESILKQRILRDNDRSELVFDLASFYRDRGRAKEVDQVFETFINAAEATDRQRRLNDVTSFLASGTDSQSAEKAARLAASQPDAGREELLRLGDVLVMRGNSPEAMDALEKAWALSDSPEKRVDVDERIYSMLSGEQQSPQPVATVEQGAEFRLPAFFTGEGFGTDAAPSQDAAPPEAAAVSDAVMNYALAQTLAVWGRDDGGRDAATLKTLPKNLQTLIGAKADKSAAPDQPATPERVFRAAWWCWRADQSDLAYALLRRLIFDEHDHRQTASLEVEKLLLDLSMSDRSVLNTLLASRQLRLLSTIDPDNRSTYQLRLAELEGKRANKRGLAEAVKILETLVKEDPQNEAVLASLSQFYLEGGQREKAMALWEQAARKGTGNVTPLLERYGEILVAQRKYKEFVDSQCQIFEKETDVKRRRELFERCLERLLWLDIQGREGTDEEKKERLALMEAALMERSRRHPFDGFWHEALAGVYEKQGDATKAFAEMKQAYYTAPDTPFSLGQLRAAALRVGDLKSAIYFQKQIAATTSGGAAEAGEWRQLVQLLEDDFRMKEADQARRLLESRFSQDPAALEDLAKYYAGSAQEESARRVYEQVARIRAWDAGNLLRLALQQKQMGDQQAAQHSLLKLLDAVPQPPVSEAVLPENLAWPLLEERHEHSTASAAIIAAIDNAPGLEQADRDVLRRFFSLPRGEFSEVPDEAEDLRLRAVEELSLMKALPGDRKLTAQEENWASYYGQREREAFHARLFALLGPVDRVEARFVLIWLAVKSHGMKEAIQWVRAPDPAAAPDQHRRGLLQAVVNILADDPAFEFTAADITALSEAGLFGNAELVDIARKFEGRRLYDLSIILALAAQKNAPSLVADYAMFLARLAEGAGDYEAQRRFLEQVWSKPLEAGKPDVFDPFVQSFSALWKSAHTSDERQRLLKTSWERLQRLPKSGLGAFRQGRLLGIVGASDASVKSLAGYMENDLLASRPFAEPLTGRLPPGVQPGPRIDEVNHLRSYWEDVMEWEEVIKQDGLARELLSVDAAINTRNAGTSLGPRSNYEFGNWRNTTLLRQLKFSSYPGRILKLREFIQTDDSVESLLELGGLLESQGYSREAIEVYQRLPERAPTNTEYCEQLLRVCENSWESAWAIPYIERLLVAEPQLKPQGISDETLWEKHAVFIARLKDTGKLRILGFRGNLLVKAIPGRVPQEVPYLKELALLLEKQGDRPGALAAWEELHRLWTEDVQAGLHRAILLNEQGNKPRALETLRSVSFSNLWNEHTRAAFVLRSKLAAESGLWDEVRDLMNLAAGGSSSTAQGSTSSSQIVLSGSTGNATGPQTACVLELSRVLVSHQRQQEAQSLLLRAERAVKDDADRFRLRLEQIILLATTPTWSPAQDQTRIAALLRLGVDQEDAIQSLLDFISKEAMGPRAKSWVQTLTQASFPREPLTSLVLSGLAGQLDDKQAETLFAPWTTGKFDRSTARELAVGMLLKKDRPLWARELAVAGRTRGLADSPTMIPVLAALGDRHGMDDLFARLVRMTFPGGSDCVAHATAFAKSGRKELAAELFSLAVDRVRATGISYPNLMESYARFLMGEHRYEEAETLLVQDNDGLGENLPKLLVELYQGWNKLDRLEAEMVKFHLPDGLWHEARFLASQAKAKP